MIVADKSRRKGQIVGASSARTQDLTGRSIATGAALLALAVGGLTMTDRALGAAPPAPPICAAPVAATFTNTQGLAIPDNGAAVTRTITVSGAPTVLRDIDLRTSITHGHTGDLRITLTHNGKTVMIKDETAADGPDPGSANGWADLWNGTLWDDNAGNGRVATDFSFTADGAVSPLVPEAALGRFIGDDPNGVWTLAVQDTADLDTGSLNSWSLDIAGLTETPPLTTTVHENTSAVAIPDNGAAVTRTINVTGAKGYLWDVNLQTFLAHEAPTDLDVTLSHLGRTVTITTDNGGATSISSTAPSGTTRPRPRSPSTRTPTP